jgi:hypothetical protein
MLGRTLEAVLMHVERGNSLVLEMSPPQRATLSRRRGSSWMPRRMASVSSGSASSGSARSASRSSASTLRTVRQEPPSAPPRRNSCALVIREGARTSSAPRNRKRKPRKDDAAKAASELAEAEAARAEEEATREAIAGSLRDIVPVENVMPLDGALEWSRQDWERKEAEQQRRLLDLAAA